MDIGNIMGEASNKLGAKLGGSAIKRVMSEGDGSGEGIPNNKVGAVIGGVGAFAVLSTLGIAASPALAGGALLVGALAGATGESKTKKVVGVISPVAVKTAKFTGNVLTGAAALTGGVVGLTALGVIGGVSGVLGKFKGEQAHLKEGLGLLEKGDYSKAILSFNSAISKNSNNPIVYLVRGASLEATQQPHKALQDYTKAIELDPSLIEAYKRRGLLYLSFDSLEEYGKAIGDLSKVIQSSERDSEAYFSRAKAYVAIEDYISAIADYDHVINLDANHAQARFLRGCLLSQIGDYQSSVLDFNQFISLNPQVFAGYYQRANSFVNLEDYKSAIKDLNFLIDNYPQDDGIADLYLQRAVCYQNLTAHKAAISDYSEVILRIPDNAEAFLQRGITYAKNGNLREAENDLHRVIELDKDNVDAYIRLGYLSIAKKNNKHAISFFQTAIKLLYSQSRLTEIPPLQAKLKSLKEQTQNASWWNKKLF
jgi:tetratricopeptide (TPR) repeat protein